MRYALGFITLFLISVAALAILWPHVVHLIPAGHKGVLFKRLSGGTVLNYTLEEGLHLVLPWNIVTVYDTRIQQKVTTLELLTSDRLKSKYDIEEIKVIPTPVGLDFSKRNLYKEFNLPENKKYFLYPASYFSHKNFDIIISLGKLIKDENLPFLIVLTIDERIASDFIKKMDKYNLNCIFNVGKVAGEFMPSLYQQCDVLLFPSLLETYGLPYIEAMAINKPILTSDLDFAHAICNEIAYYFDPFNAESILNVMLHYSDDDIELKKRLNVGKKKIELLPDWQKVFLEFEEQIEIILK